MSESTGGGEPADKAGSVFAEKSDAPPELPAGQTSGATRAEKTAMTSEVPADGMEYGDDPPRTQAATVTTVKVAAEQLRELVALVESLSRSVEEANRLSLERERIIDSLHQENQRLRHGELQQAMQPLLRDLVRLYDDLSQTAAAYAGRAETTPQDASRDFRCFAEMITDILYRQGIERYEASEGETFNSKEHRVLGAVQTDELEKDRTIARSVRDGFRSESRVIRLLEAEVYRYVPAAPASAGPQPGAAPAGTTGQ